MQKSKKHIKYTLIDKRQFFTCVFLYLQSYDYMKFGGTMLKDDRKVWTVNLLDEREKYLMIEW